MTYFSVLKKKKPLIQSFTASFPEKKQTGSDNSMSMKTDKLEIYLPPSSLWFRMLQFSEKATVGGGYRPMLHFLGQL